MNRSLAEIIENATTEKRQNLLEHEVYSIISMAGMETPRHLFLTPENLSQEAIQKTGVSRFALKIVAPDVLHKTDRGGILLNVSQEEALSSAKTLLNKFKNDHPRGVLFVEMVPYSPVPGSEILLGIRRDDAFGPVVVIGFGGTATGFYTDALKQENSIFIASPNLEEPDSIANRFMNHPLAELITGKVRGGKTHASQESLQKLVSRFCHFAKETLMPVSGSMDIEEFEINPMIVHDGKFVALDGVLRTGSPLAAPPPRPVDKVGNLLRPSSIGLVGVSSKKVTPAGTILKNILATGISPEKIHILHPKEKEIMGCQCHKTVSEMKENLSGHKLDIFIVGAPASGPKGARAADIIEDLVNNDCTHSMTIITAGFGETRAGEEQQKSIRKRVQATRSEKDGGVVVNGPNTLGNVFRGLDTKFTPPHKSSYSGKGPENSALICQSGAYMITRLSNMGGTLKPVATLSIGNQMDLTFSDYLKYLSQEKDIHVFGLYAEGFEKLDGLELARVIKHLRDQKKLVFIYKAGKTPEGEDAAKGHTAAAAGDYVTCRTLLENAGAVFANSFYEFDKLMLFGSLLYETVEPHINSNKTPSMALVSNAGFEKCSMGDNLYNRSGKRLANTAKLEDKTLKALQDILDREGISSFMDLHTILDLTPMANDRACGDIVDALLGDKNVEAAVISLVPETTILRTLPEENFNDPDSAASRIITSFKDHKKPVAAVIESGSKYDPVIQYLNENGVPAFRHADEATAFLARFLNKVYFRQ